MMENNFMTNNQFHHKIFQNVLSLCTSFLSRFWRMFCF